MSTVAILAQGKPQSYSTTLAYFLLSENRLKLLVFRYAPGAPTTYVAKVPAQIFREASVNLQLEIPAAEAE